MKNLNLFTLIMTLTTSALGADVAWVKTKFWQSPYYQSAQAKIVQPSGELLNACQWIDSVVREKNGKVRVTDKSDMEALRTLALPGRMEDKFSIEILTSLPVNGNILGEIQKNELFKIADQEALKTVLPGYTQRNHEVRLDYFSQALIFVNPGKGSLTEISSSLGLSHKPIQLLRKSNGIFLKVLGLDTACDLALKRSTLSIQLEAAVKILFDEQIKLTNFYSFVEKAYAESERKAKSYRSRAAILGVKLGNHLAQDRTKSQDFIEDQIESLMEFLFVDNNFKLSSAWKIQGQDRFLSLDGTSQPVKMKIEIE